MILLFSAMEKSPLVSRQERLTLDKVQKVKDMVRENTPGNMKQRQVRTLALSEEDLNILLNYGVLHGLGYEGLLTEIRLPENRIHLGLSLDLPAGPLGNYLNLFIILKKTGPFSI
nr:hypothetical protein [Desulfobacula sp.]